MYLHPKGKKSPFQNFLLWKGETNILVFCATLHSVTLTRKQKWQARRFTAWLATIACCREHYIRLKWQMQVLNCTFFIFYFAWFISKFSAHNYTRIFVNVKLKIQNDRKKCYIVSESHNSLKISHLQFIFILGIFFSTNSPYFNIISSLQDNMRVGDKEFTTSL